MLFEGRDRSHFPRNIMIFGCQRLGIHQQYASKLSLEDDLNRNKQWIALVLILFSLPWIIVPGIAQSAHSPAQKAYARIKIGLLSDAQIDTLKKYSQLDWWIEADDQLLALANHTTLASLKQTHQLEILDIRVDESKLRLIAMDHFHFQDVSNLDVWLLMEASRYAVVQTRSPLPYFFFHNEHSHAHVLKYKEFTPNTVLSKQWRPKATKKMTGKDPLIQSLINQIDASRWLTSVYYLASFNRFTRGTNIREAETWLLGEFSKIQGLTVRSEPFTFGGTNAYNVVAELPGDGTTDDIYIIGAHYDSISENTGNSAPGAEDNASGTAAVLELAHIFAARPPSARVIFTCYSGEEQGLHGSRYQINQLIAEDKRDDIKAVLIMDMIGYSDDNDLDTLLETNTAWQGLTETFAQAASTYTNLRIVISFNPFGSDHIPFLQNNVPAVLVIENDYSIYPGYHRTSDQPENIVLAQGYETLKMNVATLATLFDYAFSGSFADYLSQWQKTPLPPTVIDLNGNGMIDVTELIHIVNMQ